MGRIEDRIAELGIELPQPFAPPPGIEFSFDLVTVSGNLAYVSGHGPTDGSEVLVAGKVGDDVSARGGGARCPAHGPGADRLAQAGARRARPRPPLGQGARARQLRARAST